MLPGLVSRAFSSCGVRAAGILVAVPGTVAAGAGFLTAPAEHPVASASKTNNLIVPFIVPAEDRPTR